MGQVNTNLLQPGMAVSTTNGTIYHIEKQISEGGQGWTYLATGPYGKKCLKIYKPEMLQHFSTMMDSLRRKLPKPPHHDGYIWPQEIFDTDDIKGYVMDFVDSSFVLMDKFLLAKSQGGVRFKSLKITIDAMLGLVSAFNVLHQTGYNYQDLSRGNFMINPETGDVKIIDNDNVSVEGTASGILGTPGYIAPEVLAKKSIPSINSDRFSLSVILFLLLMHGHPLEGKRFLVELLAEEQNMALYCTDPVFIFDPQNRCNALLPDKLPQHAAMERLWNWLPDYVKELFQRAFSRETMLEKPSLRPTESEWERMLIRFRSDVITCPHCDSEALFTGNTNMHCDKCRRSMGKITVMSTTKCKYKIPLEYGSAVMSSQLRFCNIGEGAKKELVIKRKADDHTVLFLVNNSSKPIMVGTSDGKNIPMEAGKGVMLSAVKHIRMSDGVLITAE